MRRLILWVLLSVAFIMSTTYESLAHASFGQEDCSSADGKVKFKFRFPSDPSQERVWTIAGREIHEDSPLLQVDELSKKKVLEETLSSMAGSQVYTYKVKVTVLTAIDEVATTVTTWLICSSASGI